MRLFLVRAEPHDRWVVPSQLQENTRKRVLRFGRQAAQDFDGSLEKLGQGSCVAHLAGEFEWPIASPGSLARVPKRPDHTAAGAPRNPVAST